MKKQNQNKQEKQPRLPLRVGLQIFKGIKLPWKLMLISAGFTVASALINLRVAEFSGNAVDAAGNIPVGDMILYIISSLITVVMVAGMVLTQSMAAEKVILALRAKLWKKIIYTRQSVYERDDGQTMVSRITSDCEFAGKFFTTVMSLITLVITTSVYVVGMYAISPALSGYALVFIPVTVVLGWIFSVLSYIVNYRVQGALSNATAHLVERTKDLNLVKTCNAQEKEIAKGKQIFAQQYKAQMKAGYVSAVSSVVSSMLEMLAIAIPFLLGAGFVAEGAITIGALITFNGLFKNVSTSFNSVVTYVGTFSAANGAIARVRRFLDEAEEAPDEGKVLGADQAEDLVFDRVCFAYRDRDVIRDFSCRIPKKKITAVVGANGSGKTTVFKLLSRLYEPNSGEITFGEENAQAYSLNSWREQICLIAQGAPMMAGTIRENICFGRKDVVTEEELLEVAKLSHVYDFVKDLPQGFDTPVAAGGDNFSGGQKQCIAIARAMMSKAQYLLLDESTSNLDARRERDVMDALTELMKNRTTVIIAHSVAAIRNADYVLVFKDGQLDGEGTPEEILKQTDNYLHTVMSRNAALAQ